MMLQRNLLYTAVTRAKKLVVLVGSRKALAQAVRTVSAGPAAHRTEPPAVHRMTSRTMRTPSRSFSIAPSAGAPGTDPVRREGDVLPEVSVGCSRV